MRWFLTIEFKGLNKGTTDKPSSALAAVCFTDMGIYISKHPRYRGTFQRTANQGDEIPVNIERNDRVSC
jgi:hypothetical protein